MVTVAAVEPGIFEIGYFVGVALRATDLAIRPANAYHEVAAILVVSKELDGLLECLWLVHVSHLSQR